MNISNTTKHYSLVAILLLSLPALMWAQRNTELLSKMTFNSDLNDVWGWTAPNGNEYALVGLRTGLAIVDISNPQNPREVARVNGPSSTWRDIKTWGDYAYVTNETGSGIQVINLSQLPSTGQVTAQFWAPRIDGFVLSTCHNIFIDEFGIAYLAGCNLNNGGPMFVDVATSPGNPEYIGKASNRYAHDVYVRDNLMYSSDIYQGVFSITDVSDKQSPRRLGSQSTPSRFTHNAWLSDDGSTLYTTDERANAPVAAYRVSSPSNIRKLAEFRPRATLGSGVIPHNVHVKDDYLVISHYTDGLVIVDAEDPENMIEVGNYDTEFAANGGFRGAWGAYPFFPSGNIAISDIRNGLFIIKPNYMRAARLQGIVRDATSGQLLNGVDVDIVGNSVSSLTTNFQGEYRTGFSTGGSFQVTFSKSGYLTQTRSINVSNGESLDLDINLIEDKPSNIVGQVTDEAGEAISGALIRLVSDQGTYSTSSDREGNFTLSSVPQNEYEVTVIAWGYLPMQVTASFSPNGGNISIQLRKGYYDDFLTDMGWASFSSTFGGAWERGRPTGIELDGDLITPDGDLESDLGNQCYLTGRDDAPPGFYDEIVNGVSVLSSPTMDLTDYENPVLELSTWFYTTSRALAHIEIFISNGTEQVILENIRISRSNWERHEYILKDYIDITETMNLIVETVEIDDSNPITEAAIDGFAVVEGEAIIDEPEMMPDTTAFYLEAECAALGSAWETQRRGDASNQLYAVVPWQEQDNTLRVPSEDEAYSLRFAFEVPTAGDYHIYTRTQAGNRWHNSYWVRMDGGDWIDYENITESPSFIWQAVHDSAQGDSIVTFALEAGLHFLDFSLQENATRLDKIYVVTANTLQPAGLGEEVACGEGAVIAYQTPKTKAEVFPNPTSDWINIRFKEERFRILELYNVKGELLFRKEVDNFQQKINLSNYADGLYFLSIIDRNEVSRQQIVKH